MMADRNMKKSFMYRIRKISAIALAFVLMLTAGFFADSGSFFKGNDAKAMGPGDGQEWTLPSDYNSVNEYTDYLLQEGWQSYYLYNFLHFANHPTNNSSVYYRLARTADGIYSKYTLDEWLAGVKKDHHCGTDDGTLCMEEHRDDYFIPEEFDFSSLIIKITVSGNTLRYVYSYEAYKENPSAYDGYYTVSLDCVRAVKGKIGASGGGWSLYDSNDPAIYTDPANKDTFHRDYWVYLHKGGAARTQDLYNFLHVGSNNDYLLLKKQVDGIDCDPVAEVPDGIINPAHNPYTVENYNFGNFSPDKEEYNITRNRVTYQYRPGNYVPGSNGIESFVPYYTIDDNNYTIVVEERLSNFLNDDRWFDGASREQWGLAEGNDGHFRAYHRNYQVTLHNEISVKLVAKSFDLPYSGEEQSVSGYDVYVGNDENPTVISFSGISAEGAGTSPGIYEVTLSGATVGKILTSSQYSGKKFIVTEIENGTLTIGKNPITITSKSNAWTYDGEAHSDSTVEVTSGELIDGDSLVATATGEVKNVADTATGNNLIADGYKIMRGTVDVTEEYAITAVAGTLTINPKAVIVTAQDKAFTYNGTAQSWPEYDVDGLVGNDAISAVVNGSITFPSESPVDNEITSYEFTTGSAGNYSVTTVNGQLTMTNASVAITITSASDEWTYDGETHTNGTVTVTSGSLLEGDSLVATTIGEVTNVADTATGNNTIADGFKIMHGTEDVTASYVITPVAGTLTINPKAVTVTAQDKAFTYNGTAQTWPEYDVDGLVGEDAISAVVTGSITFPSESPVDNVITSYEFTTGTPGNYSVTMVNGELTMVNASVAITITAASDEWTYDGSAHSNNTVTVTSGELLEGDELVATATGEVTNVSDTGAGNNTIAAGYKILHGEEDVTANYNITVVAGTLTITPATLTITANPLVFTYNGQNQGPDDIELENGFDEYVTVQGLVGNDVLTKVTITGSGKDAKVYPDAIVPDGAQVGSNTGNYSITYIAAELTINPRSVTLTSESSNKPYDGTPLTKPAVTVGGDGFVNGEVTDIKATGSVTTVAEGVVTNTITYTAGESFNEENYTITKNEGKLHISPSAKALVITSSTKSWEYDGQTHKDEVYTVSYDGSSIVGSSDGTVYTFTLPTGDKITITPTTGGVIEYSSEGVTNNYIYVLQNPDCYDNVTSNKGTLSITKRPITLTANNASSEYTGSEITYATAPDAVSPYYSITDGSLAEGQSITAIELSGNGTKVGEYGIVIDANSIQIGDYTGNYDPTLVPGKLTISKNSTEITVVPGSDSKMYDGTPLTKNEHEDFTVTGVPEGFTWTAVADGTVTNVVPGEDEKAVNAVTEFKIFDADGNDVTDQFSNIDKSATGTLTITARSVTLTSKSDEKEYDGTPLTSDEITTGGDGFVNGEGCTFDVTGTITNVGSEQNAFTYTLNDGTTATNYSVAIEFGTLEITPLEAVLEWCDTKFPYDGENHVPTATVSNLIDGDECKVTVAGEKKEVGEDYVATATELSNPNYKLPEKNTTSFSIYGCVVIFKNDDGTVLAKIGVPFGTKPVYEGDEPTKEPTAQYIYEFDGWTPEIVEVEAEETVYTATYQQKTRTYTVEPSELPEGVKLSITDKKTVDAGDDVTFTITIEKGYDRGESFAVKVNGKAITPDENGTYKISGILENVKITVSGVEKVSYSVVDGDKTKHVIGENTTAKFVLKRNVNDSVTFSRNTEILLDGKALEAGQFTKASGSLIVELKADFLNTLSVGEHVLTVRFDDYDGDVNARLIIEKAADPAPQTGDTGNLTLWIVIGVVSLVAFLALFLLICKRRKDEEEEEI